MTSIRQPGTTPVNTRKCSYPMSPMSTHGYAPPHMASLKKSPSHEGYSSGSDSKKSNSMPGAKRRPSRAGTRSVTTLTAAQLERKRANDREAQRAIRQRTKDHIESLERRIAELSSQQDVGSSSRISELLRRNEELENENAVLRTRLSHALTSLGCADSTGGNVMGSAENNLLPTGNAPSPTDRIQMLSQPRPSSTSTARSVHSVSNQQPVSQPDQWQPQPQHPSYPPSASSSLEAGGNLTEVSGHPDSVRWNEHPQHPHQHQHSGGVTVSDNSLHHVETAPMPYSYVLDATGRPMYPMENAPMPQQPMQPMPGYGTPTSNHSPHPEEYRRHMSVQMAQPPQTQYPQYPTHGGHQGYMPNTSHPGEMQQMMPQPMMGEQGHIMYHMGPNMKVEQH